MFLLNCYLDTQPVFVSVVTNLCDFAQLGQSSLHPSRVCTTLTLHACSPCIHLLCIPVIFTMPLILPACLPVTIFPIH